MPDTPAGGSGELRDFGSFLHRRRGWLAWGVLLGLAAGIGFLLVAPKTYDSAAKVNVEATGLVVGASDERTNSGINLDTEAQLVKSAAVLELAADEIGTDADPLSLASKVAVTVPANTTIMVISYSASTAEAAQQGAQAFAESYLREREQSAQGLLNDEVDQLREDADQTAESLSEVQDQLDDPSLPADERVELRARKVYLNGQLASLSDQLAPLQSTAVSPGTIINDAVAPKSASAPNPLLIVPSGAVVGLLAGLGIALLRERRDDHVYDPAQVGFRMGVPVVGTMTQLSDGRFRDHEVARVYHSVRARSVPLPTILIASPASSAARRLALLMARTAARAGDPTTYVCRDLGPGEKVAAELLDLKDAGTLDVETYAGLDLVAEGELQPLRLREELRRIRADSRLPVLEPPGEDLDTELPMMAQQVDVVLVVMELGTSRQHAMEQAVADAGVGAGVSVSLVAVAPARRRDKQRRRWRRRSASS